MLVTANIKRLFTSTFTKVHNYRFMNDRFAYIARKSDFANTKWFGMMTNTIYTKWFGMMTNTIYDMNISIAYITRTHRFADIGLTC